jgi:hypothetical protein
VVRPVSGTVALAPDRIVADVTEARLGIPLPLTAVLVPGNVSVTSRIEARAQPLAGTVSCFWREARDDRTLDLRADLSANGPPTRSRTRVAPSGSTRATARSRMHRSCAHPLARAVAGLLRARPSS